VIHQRNSKSHVTVLFMNQVLIHQKEGSSNYPSVLVGEAVMVGTLMNMEDLFLICNNSHIDAIVQY
jgi:hypothetical protein